MKLSEFHLIYVVCMYAAVSSGNFIIISVNSKEKIRFHYKVSINYNEKTKAVYRKCDKLLKKFIFNDGNYQDFLLGHLSKLGLKA